MPSNKTPTKALPYMPWDCAKPIVVAIQCIAAGTANEAQQKVFMKWLINNGCGTYDLTYFPESRRDSDFADGKAFIGQQLVRQIKLKTSMMKTKE